MDMTHSTLGSAPRGTLLDSLLHLYAAIKLADVDVHINGSAKHDIVMHDPTMWRDAILRGSLGLGEAYQDGRWDSQNLAEFCTRLRSMPKPMIARLLDWRQHRVDLRYQARSEDRAEQNVAEHYDFGNAFYEKMLDPSMQYSCAYFERGAPTLDRAQHDKKQLIGEKLQLKPGMRVLDIGCGWCGLADHLIEHFGVEVVGITLSREQYFYATTKYAKRIKDRQLDVRLLDYREAPKKLGYFDRVVSVGMLEHVGEEHLDDYIDVAYRCLGPRGVMLLHSIVGSGVPDPWISTYIFPGGVLPRLEKVREAVEKRLSVWDCHLFGQSYAKTLLAWADNFDTAWPKIVSTCLPVHPRAPHHFGSREYEQWFYRTWMYYLKMCAGAFQGGHINLCQLVISKDAVPSGYAPVR